MFQKKSLPGNNSDGDRNAIANSREFNITGSQHKQEGGTSWNGVSVGAVIVILTQVTLHVIMA